MIELFKSFSFDAAHHLGMNVGGGDHPYARLHGHSFTVTAILRGAPDPKTGWLMDFGELEKALQKVRDELDHRFLNDIPGLEQPTLEVLTRWIWNRLKPDVPLLHRVTITRGTLGQGCTFEG